MDFDETRLYYSHQQLQTRNDDEDDDQEGQANNDEDSLQVDLQAVRRYFREFLRE